jgi:hypothetical protein
MPSPPSQISNARYQCPAVSTPQLVAKAVHPGADETSGTPQMARAAMVPGLPPMRSQRRWESHTAAAIPHAISRPYT